MNTEREEHHSASRTQQDEPRKASAARVKYTAHSETAYKSSGQLGKEKCVTVVLIYLK